MTVFTDRKLLPDHGGEDSADWGCGQGIGCEDLGCRDPEWSRIGPAPAQTRDHLGHIRALGRPMQSEFGVSGRVPPSPPEPELRGYWEVATPLRSVASWWAARLLSCLSPESKKIIRAPVGVCDPVALPVHGVDGHPGGIDVLAFPVSQQHCSGRKIHSPWSPSCRKPLEWALHEKMAREC